MAEETVPHVSHDAADDAATEVADAVYDALDKLGVRMPSKDRDRIAEDVAETMYNGIGRVFEIDEEWS